MSENLETHVAAGYNWASRKCRSDLSPTLLIKWRCLMNPLRILTIAALGIATTNWYAAPVRFTLEGEPFTGWEFAQQDSDGMITSINVADADGDGIGSFVTEVDPVGANVAVHISSGPSECLFVFLILSAFIPSADIPFFMTGAGDPLVVHFNGIVSRFSQGQRVTVTDGIITDFDGVVHVNPGIPTALDLLAVDVPSLPTFTGEAEVRGLMSIQVIPEPSTGALILLAMANAGAITCRKRF